MSNSEIKDYLNNKKALILDSSGALRTIVKNTLVKAGIEADRVFSSSQFENSIEYIKKEKPQIIISDLVVQDRSCLELMEYLNGYIEVPSNRAFIVVTTSANESSVASAAEEDVDGYLLKPFSTMELENYINKIIYSKVNPSDFVSTIEMGKKEITSNNYELALKLLNTAILMSDKPALAYYYIGEVLRRQNKSLDALEVFNNGLQHVSIHYKCLVGKFEALDELEKNKEAYEVVKLLTQHFPISSQRLGKIFRLAVYTRNFTDVEKYFDIFQNLDFVSDELRKIVQAALFICAKFLLHGNRVDEALEVIDKAVITSKLDEHFLYKSIYLLLDNRLYEPAEKLLSRYPSDKRTNKEYQQLLFLVLFGTGHEQNACELGKVLVTQNRATAEIYKIYAELLLKQNRLIQAENICYTALKDFPENSSEIKLILSKIEQKK